ncbi:MAG: aldehyde dehydrogenase [Amphritea sp.]|nr:aldehyde dehydrogenase [Amphritea sp.]
MSQVLSVKNFEYYSNIANQLQLPNQCFIDGGFRPATSGKTMPSVNPANGEILTEVAAGDEADVNAAVANARVVFESGIWSLMHPSERKQHLLQFAELIRDNLEELSVLESLESGKPVSDCLNIDVPETAKCIAWHAEAQDKLYDQVSPSGSEALGLIVREPIGVAALVLPWNFPLVMAAWKLGPALATGNSVVVKPSELTSMTALRLAELAVEAGIPKGVFNVVTGTGAMAGKPLGLHPQVDIVSFTGSTATGRLFLEYSAKSNMKRVVLETGGKSPCVVLDDADLDRVAEHQAYSFMGNMGQTCTANTRLIVHESLKDALLEKIIGHCKAWKIGNPLDPDTCLGALIGKEHFDKVAGFIQKGQEEGAKLLYGGYAVEGDGYYLSPAIFDGVDNTMSIAQDEIFGPVLSVITFSNDDQAVALANDTDYGLAASLFTRDLTRAHRLARRIKAGTVSVNSYSEGDLSTPFGGYKLSGFGGKDNGIQAHEQYTEQKTIWVDLSD